MIEKQWVFWHRNLKSHAMFYDFTDIYHVNVNSGLKLANQSMHAFYLL